MYLNSFADPELFIARSGIAQTQIRKIFPIQRLKKNQFSIFSQFLLWCEVVKFSFFNVSVF